MLKDFIKKAAIYFILIFSLSNALIFLFIKKAPDKILGNSVEYFIWTFQKNNIEKTNPKQKNLIIGDSRGMAYINPNIIQHNFVNFSIGGTTPYEGYITLKKYLEKNSLDTLIICYSGMHFLGQTECFEERTLAFNFINQTDLEKLQELETFYNITIDNKDPDLYLFFKRKMIQSHFPLSFRSTFINNLLKNKYNNSTIDRIKNELSLNKGHCYFGIKDSSNDLNEEGLAVDLNKGFNLNPICKNYLDSLLVLSKKNKIFTILVPTPINLTSFEKIRNSKFYAMYNNFFDSLKLKNSQVELWYDYKYLPNNFFGDPNHTNKRGSDFFSNYLKRRLINRDNKKIDL